MEERLGLREEQAQLVRKRGMNEESKVLTAMALLGVDIGAMSVKM